MPHCLKTFAVVELRKMAEPKVKIEQKVRDVQSGAFFLHNFFYFRPNHIIPDQSK